MATRLRAPSPARAAMVRWIAGLGASTADAFANHQQITLASARAQLQAAARDGLLERGRPLAGLPSLYAATRAGLRACGISGVEPCRPRATGARHLIVCAAVAAALERCYPDHRVLGERELRRVEQLRAQPWASAQLSGVAGGDARLHRPDLVLAPWQAASGLPVAVEVELTVKAPQRLLAICRAWARCRLVAGVVYLAEPEAERALERAVAASDASSRVVVLPLHVLGGVGG